MRISKVLMTGAMLVGGYIASLPVKVAEHTLVGRIADAVSDTFGRLGIRIPGMEGLISKILLLLPYLAVAAIFIYTIISMSSLRLGQKAWWLLVRRLA
jgi:hypothetical protein